MKTFEETYLIDRNTFERILLCLVREENNVINVSFTGTAHPHNDSIIFCKKNSMFVSNHVKHSPNDLIKQLRSIPLCSRIRSLIIYVSSTMKLSRTENAKINHKIFNVFILNRLTIAIYSQP